MVCPVLRRGAFLTHAKAQRREEVVFAAKRLFTFDIASYGIDEEIWGLSARSFFFAPLREINRRHSIRRAPGHGC
jgi:hypothetical protein